MATLIALFSTGGWLRSLLPQPGLDTVYFLSVSIEYMLAAHPNSSNAKARINGSLTKNQDDLNLKVFYQNLITLKKHCVL
jgi:hypothetical protein